MPALIDAAESSFNVQIVAGAAVIEFSKGHYHNAFSRPKMRELTKLIKKLDTNDDVGCLVLTGGEGRSFSVGGDFHETVSFTGGQEVDQWIDDFTDLYCTIAGISKPVVAAIDGYAIGLGLQVALCCDYRIGSEVCQLVMPELRMGIACNFGGYMLETIVGRAVMQKILFTSDGWNAQTALHDGLLHEVVAPKAVINRATERAKILASWSASAVRGTRPHINAAFTRGLVALGEQAKRSHRSAFATGDAQVRMERIVTKKPQASPSWILLTTAPVPSLSKALLRVSDAGIHIYGQGAAASGRNYRWQETDTDAKSFSAWATSLEIRGECVRMQTGVMNDPPLFMVRNTMAQAWALGTDPFMLNVARAQWGMIIGSASPTVVSYDETTSFLGVQQLPAHSYWELQKNGLNWRLTTQQLDDLIHAAVFNPTVNDFRAAGTMFLSSLQQAVAEMTRGDDEVAVLLSGGIDSGAVTTFAVMAGLKVTAYSAGSPWGNEHEEAKELTDYLGIPHVRLDLSTEELLAAVPDTIRAIGTAERDRVDIVVTVTALMRRGVIKEQHILTGLGSDLINLGMPPDSNAIEALQQDMFDGIDATRHCSEFTDFMARAVGKKLSHPYWHPNVIQTALKIHPACKLRDGREKAFFRAAMEPYVPMSTAWRKKIGIHLGGGLQGGLDRVFGGIENKVAAYKETFEAIAGILVVDPFSKVDHLTPVPEQTKGFSNGTSNGPYDKISNGTSNGLPNVKALQAKNPSPVKSLTASGSGITLDFASLGIDTSELVNVILRETRRVGFVMVENLSLDEDGFKAVSNALGDPIVHKYQTGGSDLMKLSATREKGNVVLGRGTLPLHTDGLLMQQFPDLILLYCSEIDEQPGSGETFIVDQVRAMEEMPGNLKNLLAEHTFEYQRQEPGHYVGDLNDNWSSFPTTRMVDGRQSLTLAMPFPPGAECSWAVRVTGTSKSRSDEMIADLDAFLHQQRYKYQHRWKAGDLMVVENAATLHGRTAISEDGHRVLFRGQVNRREQVVA